MIIRLFFLSFLIPFFCFSQKLFVEDSKVSFFSWAPIEDISAVSNKLEGVVDFSSGDFFFRVPINAFIFPSSLMQKHFNEKYLESDVYPTSYFKGKFMEKISILENQSKIFDATGILSIHGVEQDVSIQTILNIENEKVTFSSEFQVFLKDYQIKVPKIVRMNIADTIDVKVSGNLVPK